MFPCAEIASSVIMQTCLFPGSGIGKKGSRERGRAHDTDSEGINRSRVQSEAGGDKGRGSGEEVTEEGVRDLRGFQGKERKLWQNRQMFLPRAVVPVTSKDRHSSQSESSNGVFR